MRIPDWSNDLKPQPEELVQAILARRGGTFLNLDKALLWSEPIARGWNVYLKAVRTELPTSRKLRELGICTVALLTGAFEAFKDRKMRSCLIWAHAHNNACFFYEAMGGRRVAARTTRLLGELTPEIGFGWKRLAARKPARPLQSRSDQP